MIIRQARKEEIKKLQELNDIIFVDNSKFDADLEPGWGISENGEKYFTDLINDVNNCCLVAEDTGGIIGYITAMPKKFEYRRSKYIEVDILGVAAKYRKQGTGHKLMEACLQWAKDKGYQRVFLWCFSKNKDALDFYKNYGFSELSVNLERDI